MKSSRGSEVCVPSSMQPKGASPGAVVGHLIQLVDCKVFGGVVEESQTVPGGEHEAFLSYLSLISQNVLKQP